MFLKLLHALSGVYDSHKNFQIEKYLNFYLLKTTIFYIFLLYSSNFCTFVVFKRTEFSHIFLKTVWNKHRSYLYDPWLNCLLIRVIRLSTGKTTERSKTTVQPKIENIILAYFPLKEIKAGTISRCTSECFCCSSFALFLLSRSAMIKHGELWSKLEIKINLTLNPNNHTELIFDGLYLPPVHVSTVFVTTKCCG